jgi:cytochrome c oxidase subunit 4
MSPDDQALLPGTAEERSEEAAHGLSVIRPDEVPLLPGEERAHPSPFQYVVIFVILCVVTAAEIGLYYLEEELPTNLIIGLLLALALIKFAMVASWYMHLRTDKPIFRRFFTIGVIAAVILYLIVLMTFRVWE